MTEDASKKAASTLAEVEETVARISSNKGVHGVLILSDKGEILVSTFAEDKQLEYAKILLRIKQQALLLFGEDPLSFVRIRSQQNEFLLAPHEEFILVVLHNPSVSKVETVI